MIVNYQPVIDLAGGNVAKVEVLSRPDAPGQRIRDFVRVAESSGFIKKVADQVLETSLAEWKKAGRNDIALSINLSLQNLDERDLAKRVLKSLKKHQFEPTSLWFEIDEKAQNLNNGGWLERMRELASAGVRFSVDSFGGELSQATIYDLNRMPIAELKIDGQVIADCDTNMTHRGHIDSTVQIARMLKLATSAKGIEHEQIAKIVTRLGCTYGQGYFYGRPAPIGDVIRMLDRPRSPISSAPQR